MIGYHKTARKRYHKVGERLSEGFWLSACAARAYISQRFFSDRDGHGEDELCAEVPHLSRCPQCWPKEAI